MKRRAPSTRVRRTGLIPAAFAVSPQRSGRHLLRVAAADKLIVVRVSPSSKPGELGFLAHSLIDLHPLNRGRRISRRSVTGSDVKMGDR
jgi:hypothetical protein